MSDSPSTYGPPLPTAAEILHVPSYLGPFNAGWKIVDSISPRSRFYTSALRELRDAERFSRSPLAAAPPAVRATYSPEQRLELANYCGPDDARTCPMDTGKDHAPIAERVTIRAPRAGFLTLRGWLVGSKPDLAGRAGALSLVKVPGCSRPLVVGTHETRLGWQR